jgi:hypothetical protein
VAVVGLTPRALFAQDSPKSKSAEPAKAETKKDAEPKANEAKDVAEVEAARKTGTVEVFKDPRAEAARKVFKSVPGLRPVRPADINNVKAMAANKMAVDRDTVQRFVDGMAYDLVDRGNINGLIEPPPGVAANARVLRAVKEASDNLLEALTTAKELKNDQFLRVYNTALLNTLPKLLDNNLVSRNVAMIVLGQAASPEMLKVFIDQLKNKEQTVWVNLWALRGIINMTDEGRSVNAVLNDESAIRAGKAIVDFLEAEAEQGLPWPVQWRAMEALGSLRQAAVPSDPDKAEMATAAMKCLADPKAPPEVRATAAWALGMVRVNPAMAKYNFGLIAYDIGQLAAELGDKISATFALNPVLAERWTALLVGPIYQAFYGFEGARESGLLHVPAGHPNFGPNQSAIRQIAELQTAVAKAAVEMIRAPGAQAKALAAQDPKKPFKELNDLNERVAALKAYLSKNPPKRFELMPGGPEFRLAAGAAGGR